MKTKIVITDNFGREAKRFLKKYKSLKSELARLNQELLENPVRGTPIGNDSFKIRIAVKSKGKGKSGGLRIITHLEVSMHFDNTGKTLYLISIYDKSETVTITKKELNRLLSKLKRKNNV